MNEKLTVINKVTIACGVAISVLVIWYGVSCILNVMQRQTTDVPATAPRGFLYGYGGYSENVTFSTKNATYYGFTQGLGDNLTISVNRTEYK